MNSSTSICRVCLSGSRRMVNIDSIHLLEFYEKLTNKKLNKEAGNGVVSEVCYICHSELQMCCKLDRKANESHECLQIMLNNGIKVTHDSVTFQSPAPKEYLSVTATRHVFLNDPSKTGSTPQTFKEENIVEAEENAVPTGDIVKLKVEPLDEEVQDVDNEDMKVEPLDEEEQGDADFFIMKFEASDEEFQIG